MSYSEKVKVKNKKIKKKLKKKTKSLLNVCIFLATCINSRVISTNCLVFVPYSAKFHIYNTTTSVLILMHLSQAKLDKIRHQQRIHKSKKNETALSILQNYRKTVLDTLHEEQVLKNCSSRIIHCF